MPSRLTIRQGGLWVLVAACVAVLASALRADGAAPRVVTTIKPIHSLASALLEGIARPELLLQGAASPHSYSLKPSDAAMLAEADIVVRVSKNLEVFLTRPLETIPHHAVLVDLDRTSGLLLLPVRTGAADWEADASVQRGEGDFDVHFWLDPDNAIAIAGALARAFSQADPAHAAQYATNQAKLTQRLRALDEALREELSAVRNRPFIVFHDVTQYIEHRYGLQSLGAVTLSPEREPGAKRLSALRSQIVSGQVFCVFAEPEFPPKLVQTLVEGTSAKTGTLDEVGAALPAGPDHYFELMRGNAASLARCLGG